MAQEERPRRASSITHVIRGARARRWRRRDSEALILCGWRSFLFLSHQPLSWHIIMSSSSPTQPGRRLHKAAHTLHQRTESDSSLSRPSNTMLRRHNAQGQCLYYYSLLLWTWVCGMAQCTLHRAIVCTWWLLKELKQITNACEYSHLAPEQTHPFLPERSPPLIIIYIHLAWS